MKRKWHGLLTLGMRSKEDRRREKVVSFVTDKYDLFEPTMVPNFGVHEVEIFMGIAGGDD